MERKTQAERLKEMMKRHHHIRSYECSLPLMVLRKTKLEKLRVGDLLLTGCKTLELLLQDEKDIYMTAHFDSLQKVEIVGTTAVFRKESIEEKDTVVKFSFGTLPLEELQKGSRVDLSALNLDKMILKVDKRAVAQGHLVNVNGTIAVAIDKIKSKV